MMLQNHKVWYDVAETAEILDRDISTVCRYIRDGLLPATQTGRNYLIAAVDLRRFRCPKSGNPWKNGRRKKNSRAVSHCRV